MSDVKIYSDTSQIRIMEVKNLLEDEGIDYYEVDKRDSSYTGILGEIQLYVTETDSKKALLIVDKIKK